MGESGEKGALKPREAALLAKKFAQVTGIVEDCEDAIRN
jgi:hypothetical protein